MKNFEKTLLRMFGLACVLLTMSCEKEPVDELYEPQQISEEIILKNDAPTKEQHENGTSCNSIIDLALVIDRSGSMTGPRLAAAKNGAKLLVDQLNSGAFSALVSFNSGANRTFDLTAMDEAGQIALNNAIDNLNAGGGTYIGAGVIYGAEELTGDESLFGEDTFPSGNDRDEAQKIMILLSDGETFDPTGTEAAANLAKAQGIRIISIAVVGADVVFMEGLASSPEDFYLANDADLEAKFEEIAGTICTTLEVNLDIHPTSCPNPLSPKAKGLLPVSINGSDDFDVTEIDLNTVTLEGVSPVNSSIEDVSTFFEVNLEEPLDPYSCTTLGPDGYDDLTLKFDYEELRSVLGAITRGDVFTLRISGLLMDGTEFTGQDIVIVK